MVQDLKRMVGEERKGNHIYLGDIDPNNAEIDAVNEPMLNPMEIRRQFLYELLMWDDIVLSDSQMLTDPRLVLLMRGIGKEQSGNTGTLPEVDLGMKGFEALLEKGYVRIAMRNSSGEEMSLGGLFEEMSSRSVAVPYLPKSIEYASYLDSLQSLKIRYDLSEIAGLFQENLLKGVGSSGIPGDTKTEVELIELFHKDRINFSSLLDHLKQSLSRNNISLQDYHRLYDYIYSCYSVNISAVTGCSISTNYKNVPLHLDFGEGDFQEYISQDDLKEIRPTWALRPEVLDWISFDEFADMKKDIQVFLQGPYLMKFLQGRLRKEELDLFYNSWEQYTMFLEQAFRNALTKRPFHELSKRDVVHARQETMLFKGQEVVLSVLGFTPVLGTLVNVLGTVKSILGLVTYLSHRSALEAQRAGELRIDSFLRSNAKIITKFGNTSRVPDSASTDVK